MIALVGPFSDFRWIAFPPKLMSRLPSPVYVPSRTMIVSPFDDASIADWIVVKVSPEPT